MSWERLLALEGGTVGSIACAGDRTGTTFAATLSGVFRSTDRGERWEWIGRGLISPFVQDVAVSPEFERDGVVAAATAVSGLHMSFDRGESWFRQEFWGVRPTVTRVAISPDFGHDEVVVAGTQHEGVYVSRIGAGAGMALPEGSKTLRFRRWPSRPAFRKAEPSWPGRRPGFSCDRRTSAGRGSALHVPMRVRWNAVPGSTGRRQSRERCQGGCCDRPMAANTGRKSGRQTQIQSTGLP